MPYIFSEPQEGLQEAIVSAIEPLSKEDNGLGGDRALFAGILSIWKTNCQAADQWYQDVGGPDSTPPSTLTVDYNSISSGAELSFTLVGDASARWTFTVNTSPPFLVTEVEDGS